MENAGFPNETEFVSLGVKIQEFYVSLRDGDCLALCHALGNISEHEPRDNYGESLDVIHEVLRDCEGKAAKVLRAQFVEPLRSLIASQRKVLAAKAALDQESSQIHAQRHFHVLVDLMSFWNNCLAEIQRVGAYPALVKLVAEPLHGNVLDLVMFCFDDFTAVKGLRNWEKKLREGVDNDVTILSSNNSSHELSFNLTALDGIISQYVAMLEILSSYLLNWRMLTGNTTSVVDTSVNNVDSRMFELESIYINLESGYLHHALADAAEHGCVLLEAEEHVFVPQMSEDLFFLLQRVSERSLSLNRKMVTLAIGNLVYDICDVVNGHCPASRILQVLFQHKQAYRRCSKSRTLRRKFLVWRKEDFVSETDTGGDLPRVGSLAGLSQALSNLASQEDSIEGQSEQTRKEGYGETGSPRKFPILQKMLSASQLASSPMSSAPASVVGHLVTNSAFAINNWLVGLAAPGDSEKGNAEPPQLTNLAVAPGLPRSTTPHKIVSPPRSNNSNSFIGALLSTSQQHETEDCEEDVYDSDLDDEAYSSNFLFDNDVTSLLLQHGFHSRGTNDEGNILRVVTKDMTYYLTLADYLVYLNTLALSVQSLHSLIVLYEELGHIEGSSFRTPEAGLIIEQLSQCFAVYEDYLRTNSSAVCDTFLLPQFCNCFQSLQFSPSYFVMDGSRMEQLVEELPIYSIVYGIFSASGNQMEGKHSAHDISDNETQRSVDNSTGFLARVKSSCSSTSFNSLLLRLSSRLSGYFNRKFFGSGYKYNEWGAAYVLSEVNKLVELFQSHFEGLLSSSASISSHVKPPAVNCPYALLEEWSFLQWKAKLLTLDAPADIRRYTLPKALSSQLSEESVKELLSMRIEFSSEAVGNVKLNFA